jgi:hypothetical protein
MQPLDSKWTKVEPWLPPQEERDAYDAAGEGWLDEYWGDIRRDDPFRKRTNEELTEEAYKFGVRDAYLRQSPSYSWPEGDDRALAYARGVAFVDAHLAKQGVESGNPHPRPEVPIDKDEIEVDEDLPAAVGCGSQISTGFGGV